MAFHTLEDLIALGVFASGKTTPGMAPSFILSAPRDVLVEGVKLGNWGDLVGLVIGSIIFLGIVAYFWKKHKAGQMDGQAASSDMTTLQ